MPTKNKLKHCKYTPKQFARQVDHLVRRFENIGNKYPKIEIKMHKTHAENNGNAVCGCVAGIYAVTTRPKGTYYLDASPFRVGIDELQKFFGIESVAVDWWVEFIYANNLRSSWPYVKVDGAFSNPLAYGKLNTDQLSWDDIIRTWREFADDIRATPESYFFMDGLGLEIAKD